MMVSTMCLRITVAELNTLSLYIVCETYMEDDGLDDLALVRHVSHHRHHRVVLGAHQRGAEHNGQVTGVHLKTYIDKGKGVIDVVQYPVRPVLFIPIPTRLLWKAFSHVAINAQILFTHMFQPMSVGRYSFIQLIELGHHGEKENVQTTKWQQRGFELRLSRLKVRRSTAELPGSTDSLARHVRPMGTQQTGLIGGSMKQWFGVFVCHA